MDVGYYSSEINIIRDACIVAQLSRQKFKLFIMNRYM